MRPSPQENVDIHLSRSDQEAVRIRLGDHGMTVSKANSEATVLDNFGQGEVGRIRIEVAFDNLKVGCNRSEEVVGFLVCDVA